MTQVIIVHGYKGKPNTNWKPWLNAQLEDKGIVVSAAEMPNTDKPIAEGRVAKLSAWHKRTFLFMVAIYAS